MKLKYTYVEKYTVPFGKNRSKPIYNKSDYKFSDVSKAPIKTFQYS